MPDAIARLLHAHINNLLCPYCKEILEIYETWGLFSREAICINNKCKRFIEQGTRYTKDLLRRDEKAS